MYVSALGGSAAGLVRCSLQSRSLPLNVTVKYAFVLHLICGASKWMKLMEVALF